MTDENDAGGAANGTGAIEPTKEELTTQLKEAQDKLAELSKEQKPEDKNWRELRKAKEKKDEENEDLFKKVKILEEQIASFGSNLSKRDQEGFEDLLEKYAGKDEVTQKLVKAAYDRFVDSDDTPAQMKTKLRDAAIFVEAKKNAPNYFAGEAFSSGGSPVMPKAKKNDYADTPEGQMDLARIIPGYQPKI